MRRVKIPPIDNAEYNSINGDKLFDKDFIGLFIN
jgi:hypothetical protein